jgi:hypothetical protein
LPWSVDAHSPVCADSLNPFVCFSNRRGKSLACLLGREQRLESDWLKLPKCRSKSRIGFFRR